MLVMSYDAHTFGLPRGLSQFARAAAQFCGTLEHREDLSFGIDKHEFHGYVVPARQRPRPNTAAERLRG
jgi:hypothetical protein